MPVLNGSDDWHVCVCMGVCVCESVCAKDEEKGETLCADITINQGHSTLKVKDEEKIRSKLYQA